tara:strand:- start:275 stop:835 length:561 start_codon:yes stop_codon:yes gene_type:complete
MSVPTAPPVTVNIGVPIVDLPSFDSMDYRPRNLVFDPIAPLPKTSTPEAPQTPTPATPNLPKLRTAVDEDPRCPPLRAKEVGTVIQGGNKRISGYEIQDGKCVVLYESIKLPEQMINAVPSLPAATAVALTATVGVAAGLATPFLLKVIKPVVKKVLTKVSKAFGKKAPLLSVAERRKAQRAKRKG